MTTDLPTFRARDLPGASPGLVARRLGRWTAATARLVARLAWAGLRGRLTRREVGVRLREAFDEVGGTAVKLGQQLSIRVDMVPAEVCAELARLTDRVVPFPFVHAVGRVEAVTGRPLSDTFERLDPEPIGAASIACVYRGVLRTGEAVAVKVRRPDVGEGFAADLVCFNAMCSLLELVAIVKPGTFRALRLELRTLLSEELDLVSEARYQRLFRSQVRKAGIDWLDAPRVFHALCGPDVVVSELVTGVPCAYVIAAAEARDEAALAALAALEIDPRKLGTRVWRMSHWSKYEALFFHADPHPGNILVLPGNKLVFLDFGACGGMTGSLRRSQSQIVVGVTRDDQREMSNSVLEGAMPLPHVDVASVRAALDGHMVQFVRGVRDPEAEWWERCTAQIFVGFLQVTQTYQMPVPLDLLRVVRSTLLYDTLAARLNPKLSDRGFLRYLRQRGARIGERMVRRVERVGLPDAMPLPLRLRHVGKSLDWVVGGLEALTWRQAAIAKGAVAARTAVTLAGLTGAYFAALALWILAREPALLGQPTAFLATFARHPAALGIALLALLALRRASWRLEDTDG